MASSKFNPNFAATLLGLLFVAFLTFTLSAGFASAYGVWTCNQTGDVKTSFYTNETVYVVGGNVTNTSENIRVYIVANNNSWVDGSVLVSATGAGYITITTNSSGYIPITTVWSSPAVGSYDIVADTGRDGNYNSSYDFVNSSSTAGFTVAQAPIVTLTVVKGPNSPANHNWDLRTDTGHNSMLQLKFTASVEDIIVRSLSIAASGSGDDKTDITIAYLVLDSDGDGKYDQGETLLGYSNYFLDDGVINFDLGEGCIVPMSSNATMLITYYMGSSGQSGSTYKFDAVSATAVGENSGVTAIVVGFSISSATKTIAGALQTTTTIASTTTTTASTTTTTIPTNECEIDADCPGVACSNNQKRAYTCEYDSNRGISVCTSTIVSVNCCSDGDCNEGYYCLNYECVSESGTIGLFGSGLSSETYTMITISIVVVIVLVVVLFLLIKNRNKKPWRSKREYEERWESLRRKWKR